MSKILQAAILAGAVVLSGCKAPAAAVDAKDPAITAIIDSLLVVAMDGAATVNADRVLEPAGGTGELTLITGDVVLTGIDSIRARFKETYSGLKRQDQKLIEKHIRVLTPDVAIATVVAEGTYTDLAGWTSEPVDIGLTLVFLKEDGQWRIRHVHQSITK